MPSPFPGMNPYFERPGVWRGFHTAFLVDLMRAIAPRAAPRYFVNVEQSLYIERQDDGRGLVGVADVAVAGDARPRPGGGTAVAEAVAAPVTGTVRFGPIRRKHRWLTVRDRASREVVTVVEVLSPSNKEGEDRSRYLLKRERILRSAAHLVEIDLLRGGPRIPTDHVPPSDYRLLVSRRPDRPKVQVWPIGLRQPLPPLPIPLRTGEPEVVIDLKPLIDAVYDGAVYRYQLYDAPPDPPLSPADAEWLRAFVPPPATP